MCLKAKPFKPFVVNESLSKIWEKEEELNILKEKKQLKLKQSKSCLGLTMNDFIVQFENTKIKNLLKNNKMLYKKYKPSKIDLNSIKNFFDEIKRKNNIINNNN
jgi:hypothetical protein